MRLAARSTLLSGSLPGRPALAAVLCICAMIVACRVAKRPAEVAHVDGRPILLDELRRAVEGRLDADPTAQIEEILTMELDRLVDRRVALNRAHQLGIEVSDEEVEARIRLVHGDTFELGDAAYRDQVKRQMLVDRVAIRELAPRARVPESTLVDYFESHRDEYRQPERIQIRQIVVEDGERARSLRAELRAGADFAELARKNSLGPEATDGGLLPAFAQGELPEAFDQAFALRPGQLSEVIESPHGYHIFLAVKKYPPHELELADVREALMAKLSHERLQSLRGQWLSDLRRRAQIKVNERLLETLRR